MGNPVTWFEVVGKDGAALQKFYSDAFGWQLQDAGMGYGMMTEPEKGIGGGVGQAQEGGPGHVTFYVEVDEPQGTLDRIESLGGKTIVPVTEMEMVTFALFADPEGHVVGIAKGSEG